MGAFALSHASYAFAEALPMMLVGAFLQGLGFGLSVPLVNHLVVEQSTEDGRGRNLAYLSMAIFSGQFLSSLMEFVPGKTNMTFVWAGVIAFLAALLLLAVRSDFDRY
jgi:MFS family permease